MRSFGTWATNQDILKDYSAPPVPPSVPHPIPEGMEGVRAMMNVARKPVHRVTIALCGMAGLRLHEALIVSYSSVNLKDRILKVYGKGEKLRYVPISEELWNVILTPLADSFVNGDAPLVDLHERAARKAITSCGERAKLSRRISSHDLRATFATELYNKTLDIRLVQEILGHSSVETTQLYTGINQKRMREAIDSL